jgi:hypothetical protein
VSLAPHCSVANGVIPGNETKFFQGQNSPSEMRFQEHFCTDRCRELCQNCVETLSVLAVGLAFERKADALSYCKETKSEGSNGRFREVSAACKAGALPAELHAHSGNLL